MAAARVEERSNSSFHPSSDRVMESRSAYTLKPLLTRIGCRPAYFKLSCVFIGSRQCLFSTADPSSGTRNLHRFRAEYIATLPTEEPQMERVFRNDQNLSSSETGQTSLHGCGQQHNFSANSFAQSPDYWRRIGTHPDKACVLVCTGEGDRPDRRIRRAFQQFSNDHQGWLLRDINVDPQMLFPEGSMKTRPASQVDPCLVIPQGSAEHCQGLRAQILIVSQMMAAPSESGCQFLLRSIYYC